MTKMVTLKEPLEETPDPCLSREDIEIIAKHYGYNFAECRVVDGSNNNLICMDGYCLVDDQGSVIDDLDWMTDEELIRKFYEYDLKHNFIDQDTTFEMYAAPYISL